MQYRPLTKLEPGSERALELARACSEINDTLRSHERLVPANAKGRAYAQAIADEVLERVLPHRGYRVTVRLEGARAVLDLEEPVEGSSNVESVTEV